MAKDIKTSIIVPIYNVEQYLPKCLDSLIGQTLKDIEIICINDGSTDNCAKILADYATKDDRIIVLNQKNNGLGASRNRGLDTAKGRYIQFLDADDYYEPECCEEMYNLMEKETDVNVACFGTNVIDIAHKEEKKEKLQHCGKVKAGADMIFGKNCSWDKIYRKAFLDKYNIRFLKDNYYEDIVFLWRCKTRTEWIYFHDKILINYIKRSHSLTNNLVEKRDDTAFALLLKFSQQIYDDLMETGKWNEYKTPYLQYIMEHFVRLSRFFLKDDWREKKDYTDNFASFLSNFSIDDISDENDKKHFRSIVNRNYYAYGAYNTFETERPQPTFDNNSVNIAFGADKNTIPYLSVALQSLIDNSSVENNYDIVILYQGIADWQKRFLLSQIRGKDNFAIRFFNMANYVKQSDIANLLTETGINIVDYFKLFTGDIFRNYDKVLYLDWDLIANRDVGELYKTDMDGHAVAVCPDIYVSLTDGENKKHMSETLGFDTGILLIDIHKFNENKLEHLIELAKKNTEHDVLNIAFTNRYMPLPQEWNAQVHVKYYRGYRQMLPKEILALYDEYEILPAAVRYTEQPKIWENPCIQWGDLWWRYAAKTPFYPEILKRYVQSETDKTKADYADMLLLTEYRKNRMKYLYYSVMSRIFFFSDKQRKRKEHYKEKVKEARRIMATAKL